MKKLLIVLLIFFVISASESTAVGISPASRTVKMCPGQKDAANFTLITTSKNTEYFSVSWEGSEGAYLERKVVQVNQSETVSVWLNFDNAGNYSGTLNVCYITENGSNVIVPCLKATVNAEVSDEFCTPKTYLNLYLIVLAATFVILVIFIFMKFIKNRVYSTV